MRSPSCCGFRGVLWVGRDFSVLLLLLFFFFVERTRPAASMMRTRCLIYLSTSTSSSPTDYNALTKCALDVVPGNVIRLWRHYYVIPALLVAVVYQVCKERVVRRTVVEQ